MLDLGFRALGFSVYCRCHGEDFKCEKSWAVESAHTGCWLLASNDGMEDKMETTVF